MGGVKEKAPQTFILMWIGTLALSGIGVPFIWARRRLRRLLLQGCDPRSGLRRPFDGRHSSPSGWASSRAFMTAFYSTRLMFMTFYGKYRGDHHTWDHAHESPPVMLIPLYVLAAGAVLSGVVAYGWFVGEGWEHFWGQSIAGQVDRARSSTHMHEVPVWVKLLPLVAALGGIALSYYYYIVDPDAARPDRPRLQAAAHAVLQQVVLRRALRRGVRPAGAGDRPRASGRRATAPRSTGSVPTASPPAPQDLAGVLSRFQSGYLYHYAFVMLIGVAGLVTYFMLFVR